MGRQRTDEHDAYRAELYQLVWSEPLRTLSKRFGISDVALAKRCRAANIPLPGIGYWAKKAAGKPVFQPAVPQRGLGQSDFLETGADAATSILGLLVGALRLAGAGMWQLVDIYEDM